MRHTAAFPTSVLVLFLTSYLMTSLAAAGPADTLTVDLAGPTRLFERPIATGWIGNVFNSTPRDLIYPIKPSGIRCTFHKGGNDFTGSWALADTAGAVALMSLYPIGSVESQAACGCPNYSRACTDSTSCLIDPSSSCWTEFLHSLRAEVDSVQGLYPNLEIQWAVWNEPDACDYWGDGPNGLYEDEYFEFYRVCYDSLKAGNYAYAVTGPGYSYGPFGDPSRFLLKDFIEYCDANDCLPDKITWHSFNEDTTQAPFAHWDLEAECQAVRDSLQVWDVDGVYADTVKFVVDEIFGKAHYVVPGFITRMFATAERAKALGLDYVCRANWESVEQSYLCGLLDPPSDKRFAWWTYKAYADLASDGAELFTNVNPAGPNGGDYDALASIDSLGVLRVLVGRFNNQVAGPNPDSLTVRIVGWESAGLVDYQSPTGDIVDVQVQRFISEATVTAPVPESSLAVPQLTGRYIVDDGELILKFSGTQDFNSFDAYSVVISKPVVTNRTAAQ